MIMFREVYYEYSRALFCGYVHTCKMCFCAMCVICAYARSIGFLAVKGCLGVFSGVYRGLNFGVFGEINPFCGVLRVKICESMGLDRGLLIFNIADGAVFHE